MKNRVLQKMQSGLNGHGSKSHGLILWENDARRLRIIKQKIEKWVCVQNIGVQNENWEFIKNEIGPEWGRE